MEGWAWGCGKRPKKIVGKRPKPLCWKTAETFWVVGKRPKTSCWKMAEISAVFQQSPHKIVDGLFSAVFKQLDVVVRKRQKFLPFSNKIPTKWLMVCFLPFSNNRSKLLENGRNFCHFPTMPPLKCWWYLSAIFKHKVCLTITSRLGKVRLGKVRLGKVRLGKVRLGKVRLG